MSVILKEIWKHAQVSRVELVASTGLTSGTISNLTQELIQLKVIREYQSISGMVGRKRVMLGFDLRYYRIIGLDIGRSSFEIVLTDLAGNKLQATEGNVNGHTGPEGYWAVIGPYLEAIKNDVIAEGLKIVGLGVGVPGPMDHEKGILINPPNFKGWAGYPLKEVLERQYGLPAVIEDDARTSALAESRYGFGKSGADLVFVTMGIGIGSGVIFNGEIVRGTNSLYGQVGHMTIEPNGMRCECGNQGCWETVGSIIGILRRFNCGDMNAFMTAVREGDSDALRCMEETLRYLETALINICNMYDPEIIVLGGRLFPYISEYLPVIQERLRGRLFAFAKDRVLLQPATFGESQSAMGATATVLDALFSRPLEVLG